MHQMKKRNMIAFGVISIIACIATVAQVILWKSGTTAWIVFRVYLLPVPLVLVTGIITISSLYYFLKEVVTK